MTIINKIITKMQNCNQKNYALDDIFIDEKNAYYGDLLTAVIKSQRMKLTDVALNAKIEPRVFQNVRSKNAKDRRIITRSEALRVAVVLNLPPHYTQLLLERMNVALPRYTNSDIALNAVIYTNHSTHHEMLTRLKCLDLIEKNQLNFLYNFENEFSKINLEEII